MATGKRASGPKSGFLFGNVPEYQKHPIAFLEKAQREYGNIVRFAGPLGLPSYLIADPEHAEFVLRSKSASLIKDKFYVLMRRRFLGNGLLTSEGEYWKKQRKLAQPAFQPKNIHNYAEIMVRLTDKALNTWKDGEVRETHIDMMAITLDIVAKTLFDADVTDDARVVCDSLETAMEHFSASFFLLIIPFWLPTQENRRMRAAVKKLDEIMYRVIRERRASGVDPGDLLSRLLAAKDEDGEGMSDQQLRDELITIFLAGHETTALSLSYTLYLLSQHPEVEAKLAQELRDVLGDRLPTLADIPKLTYTDLVVKEGMRLYPPAWAIGREATESFEVGGYRIEKGAQIAISQFLLHRDPKWFPEPEAFKPERWVNDFDKTLPRCAYMPFGEGPRVCIGQYFAMMEAVLLLACFVQRYHFELARDPKLELAPSITLRPVGGIQMRVTKRKSQQGHGDRAGAPELSGQVSV